MAKNKAITLNEQDRGELYERVVKQIEREDNLIDHRVTYTLTFQSILFAALAFTSRAEEGNAIAAILIYIVPLFGAGTSTFGFLGVLSGFLSIWQKLHGWRLHLKGIEEYPSPTGQGLSLFLAWTSYILFTAGLVVGWLFILAYFYGLVTIQDLTAKVVGAA
ncbi:hypothetical protein [Hyphococcus sp.]|uniref:hypothetical protein n=1 Tax=Hyphococcus sp. TaxID=2038636 RepID=UPI00208A819A|nr:MAG: hypothetical protein DHS20C04_03120 [Marinicaulis sp.]